MKNTDGFLKIVSVRHVCGEKFYENAPQPDAILDRLSGLLSDELVLELDDMLGQYIAALEQYSVLQGMKAAIGIMSGDYVPEY